MPSRTVPNGDIGLADSMRHLDQKQTVTGLTGMYLLVAGVVALAWALGYFGFSSLWIFFLVSSLFVIWKSQTSKIIKKHLDYEEAALHRKRALRQSETVEWLNFLLNRWWVFSSSTIEDLVKKRLDERLVDIKPSFLESLHLKTFDVGAQTPNIRNVRVFEFAEGVPGGRKPCSWFSVGRPPVGLHNMSSFQIVVEIDVSMLCEDFKMIFRGRVGSKRVNVGFDMVVQDLSISGTLQAIVQMSMDVPFPHIRKATVCFTEKPDVTFNISLLRAIQMMEVPLLKSWIHTNFMDGLTKALVDPSSVDINFAKTGPVQIGRAEKKHGPAQGVLTIQLKGTPVKEAAPDDIRYTVLRIGDLKRETYEVPATEEWEDVCSFFIYSLSHDKLQIKHKCKRLLISSVLEKQEFSLASFPFQVREFAEKEIEKKDGSKLMLKLQYTALPPINLDDYEEKEKKHEVTEKSGVIYAVIHGAANVIIADKTGASDPYCVLFCDRRRVLTTPYVPNTRNPRWESSVEFFVADFSKTSLSFFVFDWDGTNIIDDDFLGSAHLTLNEEESCVIKRSLTLGYNKPSEGYVIDKACGQITVSVVFRPVPSVSKSERFRTFSESMNKKDYLYTEDMVSPASVSKAYIRIATDQEDQATKTSSVSYIEDYLQGKTILELTILQGKDLVPMDRNGFSDPFCVLMVDGKKVFTTNIKKKTLFPKWNETVTLELPAEDTAFAIEVYDNDVIGKDFMGKVVLTVERLKQLVIKGKAEWFTLERTKSGKIQLRCKDMKDDGSPANRPGSNDVFDSPPESPKVVPKMVVDESFLNSVHLPDNAVLASTPISLEKRHSLAVVNNMSGQLRRSTSDVSVNKRGRQGLSPLYSSMSRKESTGGRRTQIGLRNSESVNSVAIVQKSDNISLDHIDPPAVVSSIDTEKFYSVVGKVIQSKGLEKVDSDVYFKVRLDHPGSRMSLFSTTRVLAKSAMMRPSVPYINLSFEIDRGHGVSPDAMLIFDVKRSSKEHVTTKSYSLKYLLEGTDETGIIKWVSLDGGVELEVSLSTGKPNVHRHRSPRFLKSFSFRRNKID
ncbi:tricalbin-3-like isoform X2 [Gigantopelta aegis]|uniref:tricalbin-3-like isoform X2 n=1 Tax=Gigantopelta aegis TaxID=1735272 RepID=UPI001B889A4E|nr:tricalbin-3-like isoform X2 [Gigantopelta aegis]